MTAPRRPAPLSDEATRARAPMPPESLVGAKHDRVHEDGELIQATPLRGAKPRGRA